MSVYITYTYIWEHTCQTDNSGEGQGLQGLVHGEITLFYLCFLPGHITEQWKTCFSKEGERNPVSSGSPVPLGSAVYVYGVVHYTDVSKSV